MKATRKDGFSVLGLGGAACIACCAGPVLAFLSGVTIAGIVGTWFVGGIGVVVAAAAAVGLVQVRRKQRNATCATTGPVPVTLTTRPTSIRTTEDAR